MNVSPVHQAPRPGPSGHPPGDGNPATKTGETGRVMSVLWELMLYSDTSVIFMTSFITFSSFLNDSKKNVGHSCSSPCLELRNSFHVSSHWSATQQQEVVLSRNGGIECVATAEDTFSWFFVAQDVCKNMLDPFRDVYPLVIYRKWSFIVSFPIKNGDFP